jgi:hypothetical protein
MSETSNTDYEVVHVHIYDPKQPSIFGRPKNAKCKCSIVKCCNKFKCGLYKRGECSYLAALGWHACPYGNHSTQTGYTPRARSYSGWINERKEKYEDVLDKLSSHREILAVVGDYIFLPYAHMTLNEGIPFLAKGGPFLKENCFLLKKDFTIKNIINICDYMPTALMGGQIKSYRTEAVPKFLVHLKEKAPKKFKKLCAKYPKAAEIVEEASNVGRKALLKTLVPNVGTFKERDASWVWDGTYFTSKDRSPTFLPLKEIKEIKILPADGAVVVVSDESQVSETTKFVS